MYFRGPHGELYPLASLDPLPDIDELRARLPVVGSGIEKRASAIPGAGDGLFAGRDFVRGELVTFYDGVIMPTPVLNGMSPACRATLTSHARSLVTAAYVLIGNYDRRTQLPITADTDTRGLGGGAFLNDPRGPDRASAAAPNVKFARLDDAANEALFERASNLDGISPFHRMVVVVALRDVPRGAELFVDYGDAYWQRLADDDAPHEAAACDIRPFAVTRQAAEAHAARLAAETAARRATTQRITLAPTPLAPRKTARADGDDEAPPARATKARRGAQPAHGPGRLAKQ